LLTSAKRLIISLRGDIMANNKPYVPMSDDEMDMRFAEAVKAALHKKKVMGQPIAKYDVAENRAYILYPDGRKEYAN